MGSPAFREISISDWSSWQNAVALLLAGAVDPASVRFVSPHQGQLGLALDSSDVEEGSGPPLLPTPATPVRLPVEFRRLAESVACHRDSDRWALLYQALWRMTRHERDLLRHHSDVVIRRLRLMETAVRRDVHKMHAFVRFRETSDGTFLAWHQPDHHILRRAVPFFVRRFGAMSWSILTPEESVYWDQRQVRFGPGAPMEVAAAEDQIEDLWVTYYASIFNPTRLNLRAMTAEMPVRHWATLPEARLVQPLARQAMERMEGMLGHVAPSAASYIPAGASMGELSERVKACQACELYEPATHAVFGEGPHDARIVLIGEQPGDQEDRAGRPFIGPAGQVLDRALCDVGLDRRRLYVTNAVKHFRFEQLGPMRGHKTPRASHIAACRPWLNAELERIQPETIVCLGATAAQAVLGRRVRVEEERGRWLDNVWAPRLLLTTHPSALLRLQAGAAFRQAYARFVEDLRLISSHRR